MWTQRVASHTLKSSLFRRITYFMIKITSLIRSKNTATCFHKQNYMTLKQRSLSIVASQFCGIIHFRKQSDMLYIDISYNLYVFDS